MRNLILSGGPHHPFAETSALVAATLSAVGVDSTVSEDLEREPVDAELITLNLLRWHSRTPASVRAALPRHLAAGGGILALHTATVCFDDWEGWRDIVGARWDPARSSHNAEPRPSKISVAPVAHPIVAGLGDFEVTDEIYTDLDIAPGVVPLLTSPRRGAEQPLLWAREVGGGRVAYDALGHDERSLSHPAHRTILRRAALWALGRPDGEVSAA